MLYKTLERVTRNLLNLSVDDALRKLAKVHNRGNTMVLNALHQQGLVPEIVKDVELFKFSVILHNEHVKDQLFSPVEDGVSFQPISVVCAKHRQSVTI